MTGLCLILLLLCPSTPGKVQAQTPGRLSDGSAFPAASPDVRQADARIRQIFTDRAADQYDEAVQCYLSLLARLDGHASAEEAAILLKHLRTTMMVLPASMRFEMGLDHVADSGTLDGLPDAAGSRLVQWWRRQDTLPATQQHERLEEHLERVYTAMEAYGAVSDPRGFDDRGEIYVRLGEPDKRETIQVDQAMLAFDFRNLPPADQIPDNEVWIYRRVSDAACYVFVRHTPHQPYRLGSSADLIPMALRNSGNSGSDLRKTRLLLGIMEEVYGQLALLHADYGAIYDEIAGYNGLPYPSASRPDQFVQHTLMQVQAEDNAAGWRLAHEVPASSSDTYRPAEDLAIPIRWARFLDPDGTTRTEVYWSVASQDLAPSHRLVQHFKKMKQVPSEKYLLSMSVAQQAADYVNVSIRHKHYLVPTHTDGVLGVQTFVVRGDTGLYHLAVQWEQRWTQAGKQKEETLEPGARLKIGTAHIDSLEALHAQELYLEMSDLKPLARLLPDGSDAAMPYPFAHLPPSSRLKLYFELYHLTFGNDDQTHYTVAYEVRHQARSDLPPFKERRKEGTTVQTSYTGTSRMAKESIDLDLSAWQENAPLAITVRVTDEVSNRQVARTISFTRQP